MQKDIAIFLDLDNLVIGARQANLNFDVNLILEYLKEKTNGRIVLRRAYGDWRQNQRLMEQLTETGFKTQSHVRINNFSKNLADMQIVVDTMETLIDGQKFDIYVLLTGDRDFTPLVQSLRKRGKEVIGVGVRHTASRSFVALCDEYIYYEDMLPTPDITQAEVNRYLEQALSKLLSDNSRVRASILKNELMELSNGEFVKVQAEKGSFTQFLEQYPHLLTVEKEDTTAYVRRPHTQKNQRPLHLRYRTHLKKKRLRVVSAKERLNILKDIIRQTKIENEPRWRELIETLYDQYQKSGAEYSKNAINAVLLVSREANVIQTVSADSLSLAPIKLTLNGSQPLKKAMLLCDEVYLRTLQDQAEETFVIEEASLALYDDARYAPYLQAIMNRWQQD